MKKLKRRARKLARKINRRQSWRQKARKLQQQLGHKLGKRLDGLIDALTHQLKQLHRELAAVEKKIDKLEAQADDGRKAFLRWLEAQVGTTEGSAKQREWAADLGYSWLLPWCSILQAYGLKHHGGFNGKLPANPAYSGAWLTWAYGQRVSYSQRQPGDLLVFDWGDGGITDHVACYVGDGFKIGGNENNRVEKDAVPTTAIVGVIRPRWNH